MPISSSQLDPAALVGTGRLVAQGKLSSSNAKLLLSSLWRSAADPLVRATELNLLQESNVDELGKVVDQVITDNAQAVSDYKGGNARAFGALVGQVMKATHGKGNPPLINQILKDRLG